MIITKLHLLLGVGNLKILYDKLLSYHPEMMVLDAGYKTPAIVHLLIEDQIEPLFPYKSPQTKKGFFRKYEYVYDEYYDCYICLEGKIRGFGTDVFEKEPIDISEELFQFENYIVTPHVSAETYENCETTSIVTAEALISVFEGKEPDHRLV